MTETCTQRGLTVLLAASLLSAVLGSVHAFSIFLVPLETQFGASRAAVSLTYSGALMCLTLAVFMGHRLYGKCSAAWFVLFSAGLGVCGVMLAGWAPSLPAVWLGYSVLFGTANGLGYGFGLQIAAQVNPGKEGLAMGVVTAAYALGAVISPLFFAKALEAGGFGLAMSGLAASLIAVGVVGASLIFWARARFVAEEDDQPNMKVPPRRLVLLWVTYFGGVMAGLMVIGHAAGIALATHGAVASWMAPAFLALCNLAGSLSGGHWADGQSARRVLSLLPGLTVVALLALMATGSFVGALIFLGVIGFAYGGTIAAHPAYIAKAYGGVTGPRVYGRIFTAWGCAGLAGPWLAGVLYDANGSYLPALAMAAAFAAVSVVTAQAVFRCT